MSEHRVMYLRGDRIPLRSRSWERWLQVHVKVALKPMVQGVSNTEEALELLEYISACSSLQLRGLAADYGTPKVGHTWCFCKQC